MRKGFIDRRNLLLSLAALSSPLAPRATATAGSMPSNDETLPPPSIAQDAPASLTDAARLSGRFFGAAVRPEWLGDTSALRDSLLANCACFTPELHLKWNSLEPHKGQFNYGPMDKLLDSANNQKVFVRGHTLIWEQSTPKWALAELSSRQDWNIISDHFSRTLSRYGKTVKEWDVINEPIDTIAGVDGLRRTAFFDAFGPSYIRRALEEARDHAPDAHLLINDFGFEYNNSTDSDRRQAFLALMKDLVRTGAPINGVGLQAHLDLNKGNLAKHDIVEFIRNISDLGLSITISELDVKESDTSAPLATRDQRVADEVERYLDIVLTEPAVRGIVTWGLSDRYSWLSNEDGTASATSKSGVRENRGLPYDRAYRTKPMYWAILKRLRTSPKVRNGSWND